MKKKVIGIVLIVAIFTAGIIGLRILTNSSTAIELSQTSQEGGSVDDLQISEDGKLVSYNGVAGEIALETLKKLTNVETETSSFGEYVTAINNVVADSSSQFWAFYVNDQQASVGAGSYEAIVGDKIEWKLESF